MRQKKRTDEWGDECVDEWGDEWGR